MTSTAPEEQEQVEVGEVAREAAVVPSCSRSSTRDQRADAGDDQHHHRRDGVERERRVERANPPIAAHVNNVAGGASARDEVEPNVTASANGEAGRDERPPPRTARQARADEAR